MTNPVHDKVFAFMLNLEGMTGLMARRATDAVMLVRDGVPVAPDGPAEGSATRFFDAFHAASARGLRSAAALLDVDDQDIRLAAGEMTAQEMRTAKAVLAWRKAAILRMAEELSQL